MTIRSKKVNRAVWYASLTNYIASWQLVGHLDDGQKESSQLLHGPGCSKTSGGLVALDIHGFVRTICNLEKRRKKESVSRRQFRHYLTVLSAYQINDEDREELASIGNMLTNTRRTRKVLE
jgi:hypothetical protein